MFPVGLHIGNGQKHNADHHELNNVVNSGNGAIKYIPHHHIYRYKEHGEQNDAAGYAGSPLLHRT